MIQCLKRMQSNSRSGFGQWLGLSVVSASIFVGCGGSSSPGNAPTSSPTALPVLAATRYAVGTNANVIGIATGSDGVAWFSECPDNNGVGAIARISLAGLITVYPLADGATACPAWLTLGPDHAIWFTEEESPNGGAFQSQLGRIDSAGVITEYPLPVSDGPPDGIAAGGDGDIWYAATTKSGGSTVGVVRGFSPMSHAITGSATISSAGDLTNTQNSLLENPQDGSLLLMDGAVMRLVPGSSPTVAPAFTLPPSTKCFYGASSPDGNLYFQCSTSTLAKVSATNYNVTLTPEQTSIIISGGATTIKIFGPIACGASALYVWGSTEENHPGPGAFAVTPSGSLEAYFDDTGAPHDGPLDSTIASDGAAWVTVTNGGTTPEVGAIIRLAPI